MEELTSLAPTEPWSPSHTSPKHRWFQIAIAGGVGCVLLIGSLIVRRADSKTNKVALSDSPKPVSVVEARATAYRSSRTYVGTIEPWVQARIGPQLVSAYVATVLVRPGAIVKRGEVLATLDCRNASAIRQAVAMQARALGTRQKALASEAGRVRGLLGGGFVSPDEAEQKEAQSESEQAELLAQQAKVLGSSLEVNDCVLRAPFDGEVATRNADPGAFVHPGDAIVSIVDRFTLRVTADAPEMDFNVVAPGTQVLVHVVTTNQDVRATISRRAPAADCGTRTVHFELDVRDPKRTIPVNTTGEIRIQVGEPSPALSVPLVAAAVRGEKASLFVVDASGVAHEQVLPVKGEYGGELFLEPKLPALSHVVVEGRMLLADGDRVSAALDPSASNRSKAASSLGATL